MSNTGKKFFNVDELMGLFSKELKNQLGPIKENQKNLIDSVNFIATNCLTTLTGAVNEVRDKLGMEDVKINPPKIEQAIKKPSETSDEN